MTDKEAIQRIAKRICCQYPVQQFCNDNCMNGVDQCEFSLAISALEKAEKYKWHDLRKNPEDLPKCDENGESEELYIFDGIYYGVGWLSESGFDTSDRALERHGTVDAVAWRYIAPFEEEEECLN